MAEAPAVQALVFDVFGTVVDWRGSVIREGQDLARRQGWAPDRVDWEGFADAWRREGYVQPIARVGRGEAPWERVDVLHRRKLDELLVRNGIEGLPEAEVAAFNRVWHRLVPWPDSVPGLTRLRHRYIISPLSNGDFALLTGMARRAGLPWDCILAAELFGAFKPAPKVYLGAADLLGLPPEAVMLVAAHPGDLLAARACGLRTGYVPRPLEWGPAAPASGETTDDGFDVVASDFLDLADRLGAGRDAPAGPAG